MRDTARVAAKENLDISRATPRLISRCSFRSSRLARVFVGADDILAKHRTYFVRFGFLFSRFPMRLIEPGDRGPDGVDLVLAFHEPVSWEHPPIHPFFYSAEAGQRGGYRRPGCSAALPIRSSRMTRRGTSLAPSKCFTSLDWSARATWSRVARCLGRKKAILIEILKFGCSIMLSRVRKE